MTPAETGREWRFGCTRCGACCNRSPEVALSEAAPLADMFVFRLMFRLYDLPRTGAGADYFEARRLLNHYAARKYTVKQRRGGRPVEHLRYLMVSALSLDTAPGACAARHEGGCSIYDRRPLACRTVPFHYSRPEAAAVRDFAAFVATPGYRCETGPGAPVVLAAGRIVDEGVLRTRAEAAALAARDRPWAEAIVRRLRTGDAEHGLPSLSEIEANAAYGATTVPMRAAWRIAVEAGLLDTDACHALIAAQAALIDRLLTAPGCSPDARDTLMDMRADYAAPVAAA